MPRPVTAANANGHRRRQLIARVKAEETHCAICGQWVDQALGMNPGQHGPRCAGPPCAGCVPHPMRAEVDEDIPRTRGGSAIDRTNCRLTHRICNQRKGKRTLAEHASGKPPTPHVVTNLVQW